MPVFRRRGATWRLMFLPIRSGERSPYRSAAHNATERAISFLIPFYWSTREKSYACGNVCACATREQAHSVKVHAHRGDIPVYGPSDVYADAKARPGRGK